MHPNTLYLRDREWAHKRQRAMKCQSDQRMLEVQPRPTSYAGQLLTALSSLLDRWLHATPASPEPKPVQRSQSLTAV